MGIALPSQSSGQNESLAMMIKAQFTEYDVYNVIGHTEIPTKHVPALVRLLTLQRVEEIKATEKPHPKWYGLQYETVSGEYDYDAQDMSVDIERLLIVLERAEKMVKKGIINKEQQQTIIDTVNVIRERISVMNRAPKSDERYLIKQGTPEAKEAYESEMEKWKLKQLILYYPDAMIATILYGHNFYYGLCMRSKDRKIRTEGLRLGSANMMQQAEAQGVGITQKAINALSLGRLGNYEKKWYPKENK